MFSQCFSKCGVLLHKQIRNCDRCQRNTSESKSYDVLHPVKVVSKVWYLVGIDLIDAGKVSAQGNRYLLTMTDYFSKYVEAIPLPDKSAVSVAKGLYKAYCRHGAPAHIISDQGREFVNQVGQRFIQRKPLTDICVAACMTLLHCLCCRCASAS